MLSEGCIDCSLWVSSGWRPAGEYWVSSWFVQWRVSVVGVCSEYLQALCVYAGRSPDHFSLLLMSALVVFVWSHYY